MKDNFDLKTVEGFGSEWTTFDQSELEESEITEIFTSYFSIFPWENLPNDAVGFDMGCGSGRWAKCVAPKVGTLHCIDASSAALQVAKNNLSELENCQFYQSSVDKITLLDNSMDFGYSLGVLHHIPNTFLGIKGCVEKLKPGAPLLLYLYYAFDNRPFWFRLIWKISDIIRQGISQLPYPIRYGISQIIAVLVYLPLARFSLILEKIGFNVDSIPLSFYRNRSFYVMRNDALDRFGTKLESRFTQDEIRQMMEAAGLINIVFSDLPPYWCSVGYKK
ncbi:class I SAM-dependent methyltransferase [Phormidium pseudopriestleyi FRX01]|uniref:Class I SAM-dependent methyltransferase n=1 Tax=Phormidium pseudopriestleyi FRX01 TaxID=1759528 RepID=A0ABS3FL73_9CYAN|nr:class I SAM-dependent methyltransferase [Phormidium pseudopriestleyi]MBO0347860.1 class I SAM-dependent methyltransferase [Phormidium pseudopriestleyi FRX01]